MAYISVLDESSSHGDDLSSYLTKHGHRVCLVRDISIGMSLAALAPPNVIVVHIPNSSGAYRVRVRSLSTIAPVIALTNFYDEPVDDTFPSTVHPSCFVSISATLALVLELIEALLVPLPEAARLADVS